MIRIVNLALFTIISSVNINMIISTALNI